MWPDARRGYLPRGLKAAVGMSAPWVLTGGKAEAPTDGSGSIARVGRTAIRARMRNGLGVQTSLMLYLQ